MFDPKKEPEPIGDRNAARAGTAGRAMTGAT